MDKIRIGIIGGGLRSNILRPCVAREDLKLVAMAEPHPRENAWYAPLVGHGLEMTTDYRRILDRSDIDVVMVMSPDYLHEEQARAALASGKHVYLEKPMATTIEACDRVLEEAASSGKKLMVGFNMRYMTMFETMKRLIDEGAIGEVKAIWVRHFVGKGDQAYFHSWHGTRANATSLLLQKGTHDLDMIHWLAGQYTKKVVAFGGLDYFGGDMPNDLTCTTCDQKDHCPEFSASQRVQCVFRKEIDVEDNQVVLLELDGGVKASYMQCHFTPDYHRNFVVIGTTGQIENSELEGTVRLTPRKGLPTTIAVNVEEGHWQADQRILEEFWATVREESQTPIDPWAGRMSVAAGVKAAESMREGGLVKMIPPRQAYQTAPP